MKNIIDYLLEYGDRSFNDLPWNEVDGLVLSQFAYFRWDRVIPGFLEDEDGVTMTEMTQDLDTHYVYERELYPEDNKKLLEAMLSGRRYKNMRCNFYSEETSEDVRMQFAAFTCFPEGTMPVIVFRGTDGTVVGWREDFDMAFSRPIAGQRLASLYVNQAALRIHGDFMVAGHSKGGNLAAFSAMSAVTGIRERIKKIYSFDGPGFRSEILEEYGYERIASRVCKYMPQASVVGILLDGSRDYVTVRSKAKGGAFQHNPYSWEVDDTTFVKAEAIKRSSKRMHRSMNQWVCELDDRHLEMFINTLFDVISASGAKNIPEILADKKSWLKAVREASKALDEEQRDNFVKIMKELFDAFYQNR